MAIEVRPATAERWGDLVDLFKQPGRRGRQPVTTACWCMYWRLPARNQGAQMVEAYGSRPDDDDPYTGFESMFASTGFMRIREGGRRSIWRLALS